MFEDVRRVIQRKIHDCWIILIDLNRNAMHLGDTFRRFCIARKTYRDERYRHQGRDRQQTKKTAHYDAPLNSMTSAVRDFKGDLTSGAPTCARVIFLPNARRSSH